MSASETVLESFDFRLDYSEEVEKTLRETDQYLTESEIKDDIRVGIEYGENGFESIDQLDQDYEQKVETALDEIKEGHRRGEYELSKVVFEENGEFGYTLN